MAEDRVAKKLLKMGKVAHASLPKASRILLRTYQIDELIPAGDKLEELSKDVVGMMSVHSVFWDSSSF
eukprot:12397797-Karenia_brevis.AAC.1